MDTTLETLISTPYASVNQVVASLTALERYFIARQDRRAVFVSAYNSVSETVQRWVAENRFHDAAWVSRYGTAFGNLYRQALFAYETGQPLPGAWQVSFSESGAGRALVVQDLVLGIHAHVNRDLAFALEMAGVGPDHEARHGDHNRVNDILDSVTNDMQDRIAKLYARGLGVLDRLLGPLDESFSSFSVRAARENAWQMGVALAAARGTPAHDALAAQIDRQAKFMARAFLLPNVRHPWLIDAMRAAEGVLGWLPVVQR